MISNSFAFCYYRQDFATMKESKKVDLLFQMIDSDEGGTVDANELAEAMRQNEELSFSASIEQAIDMVATFDKDGDGELDKIEFRGYVSAMVDKLDMTASEFSEYMIVQILMSKTTEKQEKQRLAGELAKETIKEEVKKREELFAILNDKRMKKVFLLFDAGSKGEVPFKNIAHALSDLSQTLDDDLQETIEIILMMKQNDERMLTFEKFGRLIMAVSKAADLSVDVITKALKKSVQACNMQSDSMCSSLLVDNGSTMIEDDDIDSLTLQRLTKLFKLWDLDDSGRISVEELTGGLRTFQKASGIEVDPKVMAQALIGFDMDGDGELDPIEFSHAIVQYAQQFGVDVNGLIDAMVILSKRQIDEQNVGEFQDDFFEVFGASSAFLTGEPHETWDDGEPAFSDFLCNQ